MKYAMNLFYSMHFSHMKKEAYVKSYTVWKHEYMACLEKRFSIF